MEIIGVTVFMWFSSCLEKVLSAKSRVLSWTNLAPGGGILNQVTFSLRAICFWLFRGGKMPTFLLIQMDMISI